MTRPNILWIMTDQFHADCIGAFGLRQVQTPNLNRLVQSGIACRQAYCNNPICGPSRACFLTGQYAHTHGLQGNDNAMYDGPCQTNVAALFRRAGWRTGMVGKAHLPRRWIDEGFEHVRYCDLCDADPRDPLTCHYFAHLAERGLAHLYEEGSPRPGIRGQFDGSAPAQLPYEHSIERWTGDEALAFLATDDPRPFFLKLSFQRPHEPLRPTREHFERYDPASLTLPDSAVDWFERRFAGKPSFMIERLTAGSQYPLASDTRGQLQRALASYYALISCIDDEIGRVLDQLEASGQFANTVVVFNADHGDFAGDHGLMLKNLGIYDSIHRIPFVWHLPGGPRGVERQHLVESVDMLPTLCRLAGLEIPDGIDGHDLSALLRNDAPGATQICCEWSWGTDPRAHRITALIDARWRLVWYGTARGGELYDRVADPGELDNRWHDPELATTRCDLLGRMLDHVSGYHSPLIVPDDRRLAALNRYLPAVRLQRGGNDWSLLEPALMQPVPIPATSFTPE